MITNEIIIITTFKSFASVCITYNFNLLYFLHAYMALSAADERRNKLVNTKKNTIINSLHICTLIIRQYDYICFYFV